MAVPYTFATATGSIPLSQLDTNFATGIVIGNTTVTLGDTITTINDLTLANVTVTSASFSNVTLTGNTTFSGAAVRVLGDFSNATIANRTSFQASTANGFTTVQALPNGTSAVASWAAFANSDPTNAAYISIETGASENRIVSTRTGGGTALPLTFNVGNGAAEVARFSTNGNFGINTSSPGAKLDVLGPSGVTSFTGTTKLGVTVRGSTGAADYSGIDFIGNNQSNPLARIGVLSTTIGSSLSFGTSNTYSAGITNTAFTIDEQSRSLFGTTNPSSTAGIGIKITPDTAAPWVSTVGSDNSGTNGSYYLYSTTASAYRFYVLYNGTINAVSTTITAISDARLKENIRDLDVGLTEIMSLKPRRFDWKSGKGKDKKDDLGWIAQEFEQTFPEMIHDWKDPSPEGEEPYKAVNADLIPVLVKAIQEQQAIIASLTARIDALESA